MTAIAGSPLSVPGRVTLLVGAACSLAGWATVGGAGLVAAAIGTGLVVGFFWAGMIPLFVVGDEQSRVTMGLAVLLLTYTLRLALVLLLVRAVQRSGVADHRWLGVTIVACALTWAGAHVARSFRERRTALRQVQRPA